MSANRVFGPTSPEGNKGKVDEKTSPSSQHRRVQKVDKIEKVSEVDENQTRAKKFRDMVEAEEAAPSGLLSPLDLFASSSVSKGLGSQAPSKGSLLGNNSTEKQIANASVPSPAYSPAPTVSTPNPTVTPTYDYSTENAPLPRSQNFWSSVDDVNNAPVQTPPMQEGNRSSRRAFLSDEDSYQDAKTRAENSDEDDSHDVTSRSAKSQSGHPTEKHGPGKKKEHAASEVPAWMKEESPFGAPNSKQEKKDSSRHVPAMLPHEEMPQEKKKAKEPASPFFTHPTTHDEQPKTTNAKEMARGAVKKSEPLPQGPATAPIHRREPSAVPPARMRRVDTANAPEKKSEKTSAKGGPVPKGERIEKSVEGKGEKGKEGKSKRHKDEEIYVAPTLTELPPAGAAAAEMAAVNAPPQMGPAALAIYAHMVGTISAMVAKNGDSHTEFVLNSPSLAGSKFFGATIAIDRYSSAPYQLNIRLTGTSEAVTAFNQNIPNLLAAFQKGGFAYEINRIDASFEKPLFRRKMGAGDKGSGDEKRKK